MYYNIRDMCMYDKRPTQSPEYVMVIFLRLLKILLGDTTQMDKVQEYEEDDLVILCHHFIRDCP